MNIIFSKKSSFIVMMIVLMMTFTSCSIKDLSIGKKSTQKAEYIITLSGKVKESGVISYAGYEMNVYKNPASNPCGDCKYQPISVYVGADANQIAKAIGSAVKRANDKWIVKEVKGGKVTLEEKTKGQTDKPETPSAPSGITITGEYQSTN